LRLGAGFPERLSHVERDGPGQLVLMVLQHGADAAHELLAVARWTRGEGGLRLPGGDDRGIRLGHRPGMAPQQQREIRRGAVLDHSVGALGSASCLR